MRAGIIAFSARGEALAQRIRDYFASQGDSAEALRCPTGGLTAWTQAHFGQDDALIFVSSCGIAVRAVAPFVRSKLTDPAVVVVDERGSFAIPMLSGHIGGANALALEIAEFLQATPVVTTATDINGLFAVDVWAKKQDFTIVNPHRIKRVSGKLLAGENVALRSDFPIAGELPKGIILSDGACDIRISCCPEDTDALHLVPKIAALGIGCRKGTPQDTLEAAFAAFPVHPAAVKQVCSIDLKAQEPGLLAFCQNHGFPFVTFSAEALSRVPGEFTASGFVRSVTGVDNVCERSAVLGSGGNLIVPKTAGNGVTMALAVQQYTVKMEG